MSKIRLKYKCFLVGTETVYAENTKPLGQEFDLPETEAGHDVELYQGTHSGKMGFIIKLKKDGSYATYIYVEDNKAFVESAWVKLGLSTTSLGTNFGTYKIEVEKVD